MARLYNIFFQKNDYILIFDILNHFLIFCVQFFKYSLRFNKNILQSLLQFFGIIKENSFFIIKKF